MVSSFRVGQEVYLTLDSIGPVGITEGMRKYRGRKFRISNYKSLTGEAATNRHCYYELEGCVSKYGVPYSITPDWIVPAREADL